MTIAYFSMEIAISPQIPTYSGGLGILAGDTIRSAADAGLPLIAVTLLHRNGYFQQVISEAGIQSEHPAFWSVEEHLVKLDSVISVELYGRHVSVRAWKWEYQGIRGSVPVLFLDTSIPENTPFERTLTDYLYGGDHAYRLCQEVVLGIGGVRMLRALGYSSIERFHMNEGHSSLLAVELLREEVEKIGSSEVRPTVLDSVRKRCIFTTHTPIPAGHDQFAKQMVREVTGIAPLLEAAHLFTEDDILNLTFVGFQLSHFINGVAKRHGEVSRELFPNYSIEAITNGVHAATWAAPSFAKLYDRYIPGWQADNASLRYALNIPVSEVWTAHQSAKRELFSLLQERCKVCFREDVFTLGYARRMTGYKRPLLLFADCERLQAIAREAGGLQIIYGGKAHPEDIRGKALIREVIERGRSLEHIHFVFVDNYEMDIAQKITAGVDLWLNTPEPPHEASGTSGMKAALNGVPSLSVLDGWWIEGCIEGRTGWAIGALQPENGQGYWDALDLYEKLSESILRLFNQQRDLYGDIMRHAIALNGAFFTSERMLQSYIARAYYL
jgi:starch phosphorylase